MVQVGNPGDSGIVEIPDILFTSIGALPGLIMMEWNVRAKEQGSVGIWDAHFRVGGSYGSPEWELTLETELQVAQCPKITTISPDCVGAAMLLHITPQSNGYFENMWAWVADHDIDDETSSMVTVAAGRGILVESAAGPTWFYGTASEHSVLYQYNFYNTSNVFAGMIQAESPYFQYTAETKSPGPFADSVGIFNNDPDFSNDICNGTDLSCDVSWAVMAQDTNNVTIAGAGLYSDAYYQSACGIANHLLGTNGYQIPEPKPSIFNDQGNNGGFCLWNLVTIGAQEMISNTMTNESIFAKDNTQASSLDRYHSVNDGYDDVFKEYQKYIKSMIPGVLAAFMKSPASADDKAGPGNKYFECTFQSGGYVATQQCPWTQSQLAPYDRYIITYKLVNENGFFDELYSTYSIQKNWVKFGRELHTEKASCHFAECNMPQFQALNDFPQLADNVEVPNPKDTITKALPRIGSLQSLISARRMDIASNTWLGPTNDIIQVLSIPVLAIQQALESMESAKKLGQEQAEVEKKNLILTILGAVIALVPFLDEFMPEAMMLKGIFTMLGTIGMGALAIVNISSDPTSAPMELLSLLTLGIGRTEKEISELANARRAMKDTDLAKFGTTFQKSDSHLQDIIRRKCGI
ncbi:hypothetical protein E4U21_000694 [Claviceps maximensis]|nr:hypothetical protein E4U21_000694 [Claviceps maximensis]